MAVGIGAVYLGLLLLGLVIGVLVLGVRGLPHALATAVDLFGWAGEQGFIGVALYIIVWAVATPFMVVVCIVGGVIRLGAEKANAAETVAVLSEDTGEDQPSQSTPIGRSIPDDMKISIRLRRS